MHSFSNLKHPSPLTIPSLPTKSNPQFCPKKSIFFFTSLKNPSSILTISSTPTKPNPRSFRKNPILFTSLRFSANGCYSNSSSRTKRVGPNSVSCLITEQEAPLEERLSVADKIQSLALEFRSLSEPIDRVKRLLQYASILPPLCESARIQENRVLGCTTQVWLEVTMDNRGSM
ncbi:hypothetical protein HAX54_010191, partial [Datura stramonium]|nr:hypothetical protein [Datura stramonium]